MTGLRSDAPAPTTATRTPGVGTFQARRERDLGVGHGRSSGYAAPRRCAPNTVLPRFRVI